RSGPRGIAKRLVRVSGGTRAMTDDRSAVTIPHHGFTAIVDAVQRVVIDKGAPKSKRKAAISAMLAPDDAGLVIGDTSAGPPAREGPARRTSGRAASHGLILTGCYRLASSPACVTTLAANVSTLVKHVIPGRRSGAESSPILTP